MIGIGYEPRIRSRSCASGNGCSMNSAPKLGRPWRARQRLRVHAPLASMAMAARSASFTRRAGSRSAFASDLIFMRGKPSAREFLVELVLRRKADGGKARDGPRHGSMRELGDRDAFLPREPIPQGEIECALRGAVGMQLGPRFLPGSAISSTERIESVRSHPLSVRGSDDSIRGVAVVRVRRSFSPARDALVLHAENDIVERTVRLRAMRNAPRGCNWWIAVWISTNLVYLKLARS